MQTREITFYPFCDLEEHAAIYSASKKREILYSSTDPEYLRPSSPKPTPDGMPAFVTYRNEMQVIACRNNRANLRMSLMMAYRIAYGSPERNAGFLGGGFIWDDDPRMRPATAEELVKNPKAMRRKFDYKAKKGSVGAWENATDPRVLYVNSFSSPALINDELNRLKNRGLVRHRERMPIALCNTPFGTWPEKLEVIRTLIMDNQFNVLILNAFELVTLTPRQKHDLSIELLRIQDELDVTVIVFTQEVRKEMKPAILGRGPIGRLQCLAGTVVRIEGDGEHLFDSSDEGWEGWAQKANEILGFATPVDSASDMPVIGEPTPIIDSPQAVIPNGAPPETVILNGAQCSEGSHGMLVANDSISSAACMP